MTNWTNLLFKLNLAYSRSTKLQIYQYETLNNIDLVMMSTTYITLIFCIAMIFQLITIYKLETWKIDVQ